MLPLNSITIPDRETLRFLEEELGFTPDYDYTPARWKFSGGITYFKTTTSDSIASFGMLNNKVNGTFNVSLCADVADNLDMPMSWSPLGTTDVLTWHWTIHPSISVSSTRAAHYGWREAYIRALPNHKKPDYACRYEAKSEEELQYEALIMDYHVDQYSFKRNPGHSTAKGVTDIHQLLVNFCDNNSGFKLPLLDFSTVTANDRNINLRLKKNE